MLWFWFIGHWLVFFGKCLFKLFTEHFYFSYLSFCCWVERYFTCFDINPLLGIWFTNIFLHLVGCLFSLLIVFSSTKVFIVSKFNLFFFSFLKLVLSLWNHCLTQSQEDLCLSFPLRSLILALIFRYFIYFEKFYIWCEVVVQLSFLYVIFSCSSIICEQYYFSIIMAPSSKCP